jgi:diguanylate cyclase (GGDEF)-like protein
LTTPTDFDNAILRNLLAQTTRAYERQVAELHEEKELALVTLASIGDGVVTADAMGRVRYLNPTAEALTGWSRSDAVGRPLAEVLQLLDEATGAPLPLPSLEALVRLPPTSSGQSAVADEPPPQSTSVLALVRRDGKRFAISHTIAPILGPTGAAIGAVLVFRDVTERQLLHLQLAHQASHDAMTGLPNRQSFEAKLRAALLAARDEGRPSVLCYMDLDQFKLINDTCGHAAGDQMLREVAVLLQEQVGAADVLARLGGDEFGLLLGDCGTDEGLRRARELERGLADLQFQWQQASFRVGVSIGVVPIGSSFSGVADLLSAADHACYIAKEKGRQRVQLYQQDDVELMRRHDEMQWVVRIQEALNEGRLELWAQPITRAGSRLFSGCELLLRMREPDGGLLAPRDFIRAAERYGLMPDIDRWVVAHALKALAGLPQAARAAISMCSINLSALSIGDETFLEFVGERLDASGLPPNMLCFEITETAAVANLPQALRMMGVLRRLGCSFALDDFGSGMSSYGYLKDLPVDYLKIDGSFVQDLLSDPLDRAMVESINRIAHLMGIETVAESVSNPALARELQAVGVDWLQGYWIGRPQPFPELFARVLTRP